jgi:hypothetical protein
MKPKGKLLILGTAYQLLLKKTERHIPVFFMIYIKEEHFGDHLVRLQADGILDCESIPVLDNVCQRHLKEKKEVQLCLQGLVHISREGRDFLKRIKTRIAIIDPPWLMPPE